MSAGVGRPPTIEGVRRERAGTTRRGRFAAARRSPLTNGRARALRETGYAVEVGEIREGARPYSARARNTFFRRTLGAADTLAALLALVVVPLAAGHSPAPVTAAAVLLVLVAAKVTGLYDRDEHVLSKSTLDESPAIFQVATLVTLASTLLREMTSGHHLPAAVVVAVWAALVAGMLLARTVARRVSLHLTATERCLVLGDARVAEQVRRKFESSGLVNATVVGRVPLPPTRRHALAHLPEPDIAAPPQLGTLNELAAVLWRHQIDRVIIAASLAPTSDRLLDKIRLVKAVGVKVSMLPRWLEVVGSSVEFDDLEGMPLLGVRGYDLTKSSRRLKRGLDVVAAAAGLLLLSPLLAAIALAIKTTSPGPVLFRQPRVGRGGRRFGLLKFRTMYDGADALKESLRELNEADGLFKIANDPRITPVGRVLRRHSLDELPQLWNVLRGQMSLVGPRPLVPEEDSRVEGWLRRRLDVTPGMTGVWQVLGSSRIPLREMVKVDYLYRANWSLWLDLKILLRTVPHVLGRRGL